MFNMMRYPNRGRLIQHTRHIRHTQHIRHAAEPVLAYAQLAFR